MSELVYQLKKGYMDQASNDKFLSVSLSLCSYFIPVIEYSQLRINRSFLQFL